MVFGIGQFQGVIYIYPWSTPRNLGQNGR